MPPSGFEYFMVHTKISSHRKVRRLSIPERWCYVHGVLAIAAESPVRGALLIEEGIAATADDVAQQANAPVAAARSAIAKAAELKLLVADPDLECLVVRDWHEHQPSPRKDPTGAKRQAEWREREKARNADRNGQPESTSVTRNVTSNGGNAHEVEVEEEVTPPQPPSGGRQRDREQHRSRLRAWCEHHFPDVPPQFVEVAVGALQGARHEHVTVDDVRERLVATGRAAA